MKINNNLDYELIDDKLVIMNDNDEFFGDSKALILSGISFEIFNMIKSGLDKDSIIEKIYNEYDKDKDTIREDVTSFINELADKRILIDE